MPLILDFPVMDAVHEEFVTLLAQVEAAGDEQLCALWDELIAHTQQHFDQEDRWMQTTGFATATATASSTRWCWPCCARAVKAGRAIWPRSAIWRPSWSPGSATMRRTWMPPGPAYAPRGL
jgi:hypothetical protein